MTVDAVHEPFRTQLTVRLRAGDTLLGVPLPGPCTFTSGNGVDILWMGPDEFLVLAEPGRQAELEAALSGECDAVVDVSAQRNVYRLSGSHDPRDNCPNDVAFNCLKDVAVKRRELAADVLAHGCSIDLEALPPGSCVQTLLARTGIVLMVREDGYTILVRQSFSDYFTAWLADASLEYVS